jgi:hypothetical protein
LSYLRADPRRLRTRQVCVATAAAIVADVALDPLHRDVPLCPLHATTGLWCPLCGGLRAVDALVHGDVVVALQLNLLVVLLVPLALAWTLDALRRERHGVPARRVPRGAVVALVVAALVFGVVRNLAWASALRG